MCNMFDRNINARKYFDLLPIYRKKKICHQVYENYWLQNLQ